MVTMGDKSPKEGFRMTVAPAAPLKKTSLNRVHHNLKARMVDFGGWEMPVEYPGKGGGLIAEHNAVRESVGVFDVSHMGELRLKGADALAAVERVTMNQAAKLKPGQAQYSALLTPSGCFVDDMLVHCLSAEEYLLVVNASNLEKDREWIIDHLEGFKDVTLFNDSDHVALIAVQGPKALATLSKLTTTDLSTIKNYWFVRGKVAGISELLIVRSGYTGEDGFELYLDAREEAVEHLWDAIMEAGAEFNIRPCGLGARNTLRLEAGMSLYGHEISDSINVFEAGLDRWLKLDKGDFIGRDALIAIQQAGGPQRKLIALEMVERGIARDGYEVFTLAGEPAGQITSGSPAPFLKTNIALALLPKAVAESGEDILVAVRANKVRAKQVTSPFYKRKKK